ncbi:MAG: hypothetical protein ACRD3P_02500 [Terriglobales bacterium]
MNLKYSAILILLCLPLSVVGKSGSRDLASAERKIDHVESNGRLRRPNQTPTVFTEAEVNAYLASDNVRMPAGVESVKLEGEDGVITGTAKVDFDRVREGVHSSNPLLAIFSGVHDVVVVAHAHGAQGRGHVHVDSVSIDDVEVPHFVLQLFVDKFLTPKYPDLGIDSQFAMPDRIDSATVGTHELVITQK